MDSTFDTDLNVSATLVAVRIPPRTLDESICGKFGKDLVFVVSSELVFYLSHAQFVHDAAVLLNLLGPIVAVRVFLLVERL